MRKEDIILLNERWIDETEEEIQEYAGKIAKLRDRVDRYKKRIEGLNSEEE